MTKEEFFEEIAQIKGWLIVNNQVRLLLDSEKIFKLDANPKYFFCPICALAKIKLGQEYLNSGFSKAGELLGLDNKTVTEIVASADDFGNAPYRKELLELCSAPTK